MIERMTNYLDWVNGLPIEAQCHFAIGLSFFGFVVAAAARETCKRSDVRYLARAIGAASFFAVAAFASHVTKEVIELERELFVKEGKKISAELAVTLTGKKGHKIQIGETNVLRSIAGEFRSNDGFLRGGNRISPSSRSRIAAGSMGRVSSDGRGDDGMVAFRNVLEWLRPTCSNAGNAGSFQPSGEAQGEDF